MTYGSESECATHYTTAPHDIIVYTVWRARVLGDFTLVDQTGQDHCKNIRNG